MEENKNTSEKIVMAQNSLRKVKEMTHEAGAEGQKNGFAQRTKKELLVSLIPIGPLSM